MPALFTQRDRKIHRLRQDISRFEGWLRDAHGDRRASGFYNAKISELRAELARLQENEP
jgi:hypothetical protein